MLASKFLAIKAKVKDIETRLIVHSLLLQDNKLVRRLRRYINLPNNNTVEDDENHQSTNSIVTTPEEDEMEIAEIEEYPGLRYSLFEDENHCSVSVIEMVKNAKEGQGKEFRLEDDIDQVADLFIQRFHHQIQLQKYHSQPLV